jgi:hypothetical protein
MIITVNKDGSVTINKTDDEVVTVRNSFSLVDVEVNTGIRPLEVSEDLDAIRTGEVAMFTEEQRLAMEAKANALIAQQQEESIFERQIEDMPEEPAAAAADDKPELVLTEEEQAKLRAILNNIQS